ncbi:MAG: ankyrin repeat domain-containing protein [Candidatus Hydrogenedentota bacterium]
MFRAVAMGIIAVLLLGVTIAIGQHNMLLAAEESPSEQREEPPQEQGQPAAEEGSPSPGMEALQPQEGEEAAEDFSLEDVIPSVPDDDAPEGPGQGAGAPAIQQLVPDGPSGEEPGAPSIQDPIPDMPTSDTSGVLEELEDREGVHMIMEPLDGDEDIPWGTPERSAPSDPFRPESSDEEMVSPSDFGFPGAAFSETPDAEEGTSEDAQREIMELMGEGDVEAVEELMEDMDATPAFRDFVGQALSRREPEIPELEEIHEAAKAGDVAWLRRILQEDPEAIESRVEAGRPTPLHIAAGYGREDAVAFLLEQGADVEAETGQSHTPLHYGVISGQSGVVEMLLEAGAPRGVRDYRDQTALEWAREEPALHHLLPLFPEYAQAEEDAREDVDLPRLHQLAREGSLERVQDWVKAEPEDLERTDVHGRTPLHLAVVHGRTEIASYLLEEGADPHSMDEDWRTPLHEAVAGGHEEIVDRLLSERAQVNARDVQGRSAMHVAAENGSVPLLRSLAQAAGAYEARDRNYLRPLHLAVRNGHQEAVEYLINLGASIDVRDIDGRSPLYWAVYRGRASIGRLLLETEPVVEGDNNNTTPLHIAAAYNFTNIAELLLEHGADVYAENSGGRTPVDYAESLGREAMAAFLEENAELSAPSIHGLVRDGDLPAVKRHLQRAPGDLELADNRGRTLLHIAAERGQADIAAYLLDEGADPDSTDENDARPLHKAAAANHIAIAEHLVASGAHVNRRDNEGQSPLHVAAREGAMAVLELLIREDGVVDLRDATLSRPLHLAAEQGHTQVVQRLLNAGATVDVTNGAGRFPLHLAAREGHGAVVRLLLENGANPGGDHRGETPLHLAASQGHEQVIQMLLDHGAQLEAAARSGETPWDYAVSAERLSILELFVNHEPALQSEYEAITASPEAMQEPEEAEEEGEHPGDRFREAIAAANMEAILELIAEYPDLASWSNTDGMTSLHYAVIYGMTDLVEKLVTEHGVDPNVGNEGGETPLHYAAFLERHDIAELLMEHGAHRHTSDDRGRYPRQLANSAETSDLLGASVFSTSSSRSPQPSGAFGPQPFPWMRQMMEKESERDVEYLLERYNEEYLEGDENGDTPLHWAAREGRVWVVDLAIEVGISVNTRNNEGARPIHLAAQNGHLDMVKKLVEEGSHQTSDLNWRTPLHMAAALGDAEMVAYLLDHGAQINAMSRQRRTPLDYALELGRGEVAQLLIERGAIAEQYDMETAAAAE